MRFVLAALLVICASYTMAAQAKPGSSDFDIVHIDGKKNPELIPEWSAWEAAMTALANGPGLLPDVLVPHLSQAESALLTREAKAHVQREHEYHQQVKDLWLEAGKETVEWARERNREITLEYRWRILRGRDRLLEGLNPAAQTELRRFVEAGRRGTTVTMLRKDLPFFLQPQ